MEQWKQFQVMAPQLVPSSGAILLNRDITWWQNTLQKSRPVNIGQ